MVTAKQRAARDSPSIFFPETNMSRYVILLSQLCRVAIRRLAEPVTPPCPIWLTGFIFALLPYPLAFALGSMSRRGRI
jgi:hypothetical protein